MMEPTRSGAGLLYQQDERAQRAGLHLRQQGVRVAPHLHQFAAVIAGATEVYLMQQGDLPDRKCTPLETLYARSGKVETGSVFQ
ncbi:MAG TPA: hypothetical protein VLG93_01325 [Sulfuricaulis sp.]|nr:hypothetical protein [Sulfuricaulis sp.]